MLRRAALLLALVAAGCGGAASSSAKTAPTASASPVSVTARDNGQTVHAGAGATVTVELASGELWSMPASSDPSVLAPTGGSVDATTGAARATFRAATAGTSTLSATRRCLPKPGQVCAQYIARWKVMVVVS